MHETELSIPVRTCLFPHIIRCFYWETTMNMAYCKSENVAGRVLQVARWSGQTFVRPSLLEAAEHWPRTLQDVCTTSQVANTLTKDGSHLHCYIHLLQILTDNPIFKIYIQQTMIFFHPEQIDHLGFSEVENVFGHLIALFFSTLLIRELRLQHCIR